MRKSSALSSTTKAEPVTQSVIVNRVSSRARVAATVGLGGERIGHDDYSTRRSCEGGIREGEGESSNAPFGVE